MVICSSFIQKIQVEGACRGLTLKEFTVWGREGRHLSNSHAGECKLALPGRWCFEGGDQPSEFRAGIWRVGAALTQRRGPLVPGRGRVQTPCGRVCVVGLRG